MITLADSFASTPAGYITGIFTPIAVLILGGVLVRYERGQAKIWASMKEVNDSLGTQDKALALLIQNVDDVERIPELAMTIELVKDRLDRHERWAQSEHERIRDTAATAAKRGKQR